MNKSGFVAVIGRPNVGKSTLLNALMGQKLAIVSHRPQTTRHKIRAVLTEDNTQMVFIDTPGYQNPRNKLGSFMLDASVSALEGVDIVVMLVDSPRIGELDEKLFRLIENTGVPSIIAINKTDDMSPDDFESLYNRLISMGKFAKVTGISAQFGKGVDELKNYIVELLPEGPFYFPEEEFTDQTQRSMASELIREKALKYLNEEIPHGIAIEIQRMSNRKGKDIVDIQADIIAEKNSHKGIIIGKNGQMLKAIGKAARLDIEMLLDKKVNLKLFVKVREGWRDNNNLLKGYGFKK